MASISQQYYRRKARGVLILFLVFQLLPLCFLGTAFLTLSNPPDRINPKDPTEKVLLHRPDAQVRYDFLNALEQAAGFFLFGLPFALFLCWDYWKNYDTIQREKQSNKI